MLDLSIPLIPDTQAVSRRFVEDAATIDDIVPLIAFIFIDYIPPKWNSWDHGDKRLRSQLSVGIAQNVLQRYCRNLHSLLTLYESTHLFRVSLALDTMAYLIFASFEGKSIGIRLLLCLYFPDRE